MPIRHAATLWTGGLQNGAGRVLLVDSGLGSFDVSFPQRSSMDGDGVTNPEELIAAAHSACFAMAMSAQIEADGGAVDKIEVRASAALGPDPAGGFRITRIHLDVAGAASGLSAAEFERAAQVAKVSCPVSKALAGVEIDLTVSDSTSG